MSAPHSPEAVLKALSGCRRVLAVTHENPDGDAVGSMAAFGFLARELGREVRLYCASRIPDHFAPLRLPAPVVQSLHSLGAWKPDLLALLDCADAGRAGSEICAFLDAARAGKVPDAPATTCIDHHAGNALDTDSSWVDPDQAATGAMVAVLAKQSGIALQGPLGEALYLAIVSDTGSFSYANTNARVLELAAEIVGNGLSVAEFTSAFENNWTLARMRLWGALLSEVELACDGAVAVSVVTAEHLRRFGSLPVDLENFVSWLRRIRGVRVALLSRSARQGSKISLRSMGGVNVREIAALFGGGGHAAAAGVNMPGTPEEAAARVLEELRRRL